MYWITVAFTDNGELGFDSGESAWEFALTAKVGSRSENFSNERGLKKVTNCINISFLLVIEMKYF